MDHGITRSCSVDRSREVGGPEVAELAGRDARGPSERQSSQTVTTHESVESAWGQRERPCSRCRQGTADASNAAGSLGVLVISQPGPEKMITLDCAGITRKTHNRQ